jgi:glucose-6-phosphate-specific signal transduction histidine kinase
MRQTRALLASAFRRLLAFGGRETILLALVLFLGTLVLRESDPNTANADEILFVLPISVLALRFGLRGGLAGALLVGALLAGWDLTDAEVTITGTGYLIRGIGALLLGTLLGAFVDHGRALEANISRSFEQSLDLLGTANLTGWFTRVNPAWERVLGNSPR